MVAHGFTSEVAVSSSLLRADGLTTLVITTTIHHGMAQRIAEVSGATVRALPIGHAPRPPLRAAVWQRVRTIAAVPAIYLAARAFRPDVVYSSQQRQDCRIASLLATTLRVPQVIHLHYIVGPFLGKHVLTRLGQVSAVVAVSHFIHDRAIEDAGVDAGRVHTVLNTIEPLAAPTHASRLRAREVMGVLDDTPVFGMVARFSPWKGQLECVKALSEVLAGGTPIVLVFMGDGENIRDVQALAIEAGVSTNVRFMGHRADARQLLHGLDVFVHPSYSEPFGLSVLEAQATGLPVVAFDEGGIPEIVCDEHTGLLVEPGNIAALAAAMGRLARDTELRASLGARARERAESSRFSPLDARRRFREIMEVARSSARPRARRGPSA
jgi:glycosyltransferase involved in cell wall biosynthesis